MRGGDGGSLGDYIAATADRFGLWVDGHSDWLRSPIRVGAMLSALSLVLACPDYTRFRPYAETPWAYAALAWKFDHPLEPIPLDRLAAEAGPGDAGTVEHLRKRTFRITVPLLAKLSGIGVTGALVGQQITSFLFLAVFFKLLQRLLRDVPAAFFGAVAMASSFVGHWGFNDFVYFDGIAWFLMLLVLYIPNAPLGSVLLFLAGFVDERAILASPLLYLALCSGDESGVGPGLRPNGRRIGLVLGIVLYIGARLSLAARLGAIADTSGMNLMALRYNLSVLPLALISAYEGLSVVVLASIIVLMQARRWATIGLWLLPTAASVGAASVVYDLSRSLGYSVFLNVVLAFGILHSGQVQTTEIRRIALYAAIASLMLPSYVILLGVHPMLPILRLF